MLPGARVREQLHLGLGEVADAGDVGVAVPVDLARAHHDVPPTTPDEVENGAVGEQPSGGPSGAVPTAHVPRTSVASPSMSRRSGSKAARASRAAMAGTGPIGEASSSPSPRQASAQATTQISSGDAGHHQRTTVSGPSSGTGRRDRGRPGSRRPRRGRQPRRRRGTDRWTRPAARGRRRVGIGALERLVASVVGLAGGEVGATGRLDDAVHHPAVDAHGLQRHAVGELVGGDDVLAGEVGAVGGRAEDVVEVDVGAEVGSAPNRSARFRWTSAASRCRAGMASSSSPSSYGERTVRSPGLTVRTSEPSPARVGRNGRRSDAA